MNQDSMTDPPADETVFSCELRTDPDTGNFISHAERRSSAVPKTAVRSRQNVRRSRSLWSRLEGRLKKISWYYHRAKVMSSAEVAVRIRDVWRRGTESRESRRMVDMPFSGRNENVPVLPSPEMAPAELRDGLAKDAAALRAGRWNLFGWRQSTVLLPPAWGRDYLRQVTVPLEATVDHRALPGGAEARNIWEINRWAEMVRLGMHAHASEDLGAIAVAQDWLEDWVARNPLGRGVNWTSALEAGLRLINFCWFDALVSKAVNESPDMGCIERVLVKKIVPEHVWWLRRHLSPGSSANNHRLGELTGLLLAVKRWPEMERIAAPASALWRQVSDCVLSQFAADGGNREQALHYHLFAFELALHACRAMNVTDGPVIERLRRAAEFFVRLSPPGEPWDYGDSDDAQVAPLTLDRRKSAAEWRVWMSGVDTGAGAALAHWIGDVPVRNSQSAVRNRDWWIAPESGMAVIERDGWTVRVDASPLGFGKMAAHGHCDALHVSIWDGDQALVIDPGTGGYFAASELRAELASWNAHNGPQPAGGFKTPRRIGTFLWAGHHAKPLMNVEEGALKVMMSHEGVPVSRTVRVGEDGILIEDASAALSRLETRWQFPTECNVQDDNPPPGRVEISRGDRKWSLSFDSIDALISVEKGTISRHFEEAGSGAAIRMTGQSPNRIIIRRA